MKTSLVVDDSRVVRKVVCRIIQDLGFEVKEAEDGEKAFTYCRENLPDLVFLDWNMPVMSGIEFLERLREMDKKKKTKVILCTTESEPGHLDRAITAGADEYIMKPFDSVIIQTKLKNIGLIN